MLPLATAESSQKAVAETRDRRDLIRRSRLAFDIAKRALAAAVGHEAQTEHTGRHISEASDDPLGARPLAVQKVVAESTMLLRSAAFLLQTDDEAADLIDQLARHLVPYARRESVLVALCRDPARALDNATAHIHLRALGYQNQPFDRLLAEILENEDIGGERLPNHDLERLWLKNIWSGVSQRPMVEADLLGRTCIARPLDALGSATSDLYAFTHVVLYASDMGRRPIELPRPASEIVADAEAALAAALDADNFDLAAELLWTWPMLGLPWSPPAIFGFALLAEIQDIHGFLPGPGYSARDCADLHEDQRDDYVLRTSYHATFVMGFLCLAALQAGLSPPVAVPSRGLSVRALDSIMPLLNAQSRSSAWYGRFVQLDAGRQESLAEFALTIALRRARAVHDLDLVREGLRVAVQCGLTDGPAVHQSLGLLRRTTLLSEMLSGNASQIG
jgi:hypothetical protein